MTFQEFTARTFYLKVHSGTASIRDPECPVSFLSEKGWRAFSMHFHAIVCTRFGFKLINEKTGNVRYVGSNTPIFAWVED